MQQLELAQMQQREANLTALAAIGPRKKRPLDSNIASGLEVLKLFMCICCILCWIIFIHTCQERGGGTPKSLVKRLEKKKHE